MAFFSSLGNLMRRPEEDYFSAFQSPEQSRGGISPTQMPQIPLPSTPVPSHIPRTNQRIGPETNPETRLELQRNPVSGFLDPDALNSAMNANMNKELRSPTAMFGAPSLVTTFGVGPSEVALRKLATERVAKKMGGLMTKHNISGGQADQIRKLIAKYPRVTAHLEDVTEVPPGHGDLRGYLETSQSVPGRSTMGIGFGDDFNKDLARAFAHELTHGAQNISLKEMADPIASAVDTRLKELFPFADDYTRYRNTPYERSAYRSMDKRATPESDWIDLWQEPKEDLSIPMPSFWEQLSRLGLKVPGRPIK